MAMCVEEHNEHRLRSRIAMEARPSLHQLFEAQVAQRPGAIACIYAGKPTTYGELDQRAQHLASYLRLQGVGRETLVGLYVERSLEMITGILGILKAGGAYLPLDPSYPQERLTFMLTDAQAPVVLTQKKLSKRLPTSPAKVLYLDGDRQSSTLALESIQEIAADNLAYVIYTSGSTGRPKGIAVRHGGVVNNILDLNLRFGVGPEDSILSLSALGFDMSVYETLGMLAAGGTVIIPEVTKAQDALHWIELVQRYGITVWNSAPALLKLFMAYLGPRMQLSSLRLALLGGDWIPITMPEQLKTFAPSVEVISLGGATEASIHSTIYPVETCDLGWKSIPYGRPMANQEAYILDAQLQLVPLGMPGELHLGGVGLARGYFQHPELTAEKFIPHPFSRNGGERLYKTGDLACYQIDGMIELLGRIDHQVKIRGVRIELKEIEAILRQHPDIRDVVVLVGEDAQHNRRLVAYIVAAMGVSPTNAQLRSFLKQQLPDTMVPTAFVSLDAFPLTPNGKVDRLAILTMLPEERRQARDYVAPRTPLEEVIAKIWGNVLGLKQVSAHDDFFELGGHSLLATQVVSRLQDAFQVEIPLQALFEAPTVVQFAENFTRNSSMMRQDVHKTAQALMQLYQLSDDEVKAMLARYAGHIREEKV